MQFGIREAVVLSSLLISCVGFVASYNQIAGENKAQVVALSEQLRETKERLLVVERRFGECRP